MPTATKKRKADGSSVQTPLETYLREINETALLTADDERDLAVRIGQGDLAARDRMVRANLRLVIGLLLLWFVVSFGFGILLVEPLNRFSLFGFKLGFWWAQQGSIYVFVAIIFVYVVLAGRIDRRFGVDDDEPPTS